MIYDGDCKSGSRNLDPWSRTQAPGSSSLILQLECCHTLSYYNIKDQDTVHLEATGQIFVVMTGGKRITLDVKSTDTFHTISAKIHDKEGIAIERQQWGSYDWPYCKWASLSTCEIPFNSTLDLKILWGMSCLSAVVMSGCCFEVAGLVL